MSTAPRITRDELAQVMADHEDHRKGSERCLPYCLAAELVAEREKVARVKVYSAHLPHVGKCRLPDELCSCRAIEFRQGIADALAGVDGQPDGSPS